MLTMTDHGASIVQARVLAAWLSGGRRITS